MHRQETVIQDLQPEELFIIDCVRCSFSEREKHPLCAANDSGIRWDAVFEKALRWNIAPMLYQFIKNRPNIETWPPVPDDVFRAFETAYIKTYTVNQTNFSELAKIIKAFAAEDIEVILLKGAHLAPFVYKDIGIRWMGDIDILIRSGDFQKADGILLDEGYVYPDLETTVWENSGVYRELDSKAAVIEWYKTHHMHLIYSNPNAIQNLEVHWGIVRNTSPFALDKEGLWERACQENLHGQTVRALSPEDLILHISVHDAYYHHLKLFGLRPCCDIAAVTRRFFTEIDWDRLQARSREWGIERHLYLMLRLSQELLGVDIPADFFACMEDAACHDRIVRHAIARILGKETERPTYRGMRYPSEVHIFAQDQEFFKKAGFFLKKMPISRDEIAARYALPVDSRRYWLYYLARIASLILAYARIYVPYIWYLLRHGFRHSEDYSLDLWLTSPNPRS